MPFLQEYVRCDVDQATAGLVEPLVYRGRDEVFLVPPGFVTDFASVPRALTWLVPKMGVYTLGAVLHDWLCVQLEQAARYAPGEPDGVRYPSARARDVDGIFRRVMREAGVPLVRRWLMWTAVRWGALANPARRPGWWRDAPAVLAISALAAPFVVPATALVGVVLLLDGLVDRARPTPKENR